MKILKTLSWSLLFLVLAAGTAQAADNPDVTVSVGGRTFIAYLPLTLAEELGYFKEAGLNEKSVDFKGGSKALAAVVGGSADVVCGYYDHTIEMLAKGRNLKAIVEIDRFPGIVLGVRSDLTDKIKTVADLKGHTIGVTAPGSSTNFFLNYVLAKAGVQPDEVSVIGVGASSSAIAAIEHKQVDALVNLDPAITLMKKRGDIKILVDTRTAADSQKVFGGAYPAATLYAKQSYIDAHPETIQKLVNAMVRTLKWMHSHSPAEIVEHVPPEYYAGSGKELYTEMLAQSMEMFSPTGEFEESGPKNALKVLSLSNKELADANIDLSKTYTNKFVKQVSD